MHFHKKNKALLFIQFSFKAIFKSVQLVYPDCLSWKIIANCLNIIPKAHGRSLLAEFLKEEFSELYKEHKKLTQAKLIKLGGGLVAVGALGYYASEKTERGKKLKKLAQRNPKKTAGILAGVLVVGALGIASMYAK